MKKYCKLQLLIILLTVMYIPTIMLAQDNNCNYKKPHEADTWIFGKQGQIKFTQDPPLIIPTLLDFAMPSGSSSISDEDGNLLFFTNGKTVWNKSYQIMENGNDLEGSLLGGQTSIIVPHPGNNKKYFVFTTNMYLDGILTKGINYSVVDFSVNNSGAVTDKNVFMFNENSKTLCAVKHENGEDYWVIFHGFGSNNGNKFYSYLIDASGVSPTPVESQVGYIQSGDLNNQIGYMKASSNGKKIALTLPSDGIIEILDFNNANGTLSNAITSNLNDYYMPFGVEFSPDNSKLYVTTTPLLANNDSYLYQFDVTSSQPFQNPSIIHHFAYNATNIDSTMQGLQLSVDGKIYVSKTKQGGAGLLNLGVIYNPNRSNTECNYNKLNNINNNGIFLDGAKTQGGLPDFMSDFLNIPHFYFYNQCQNDTTDFKIRNTANIEPTWKFNDPSGQGFMSDLMKPGYIFSDAGTYEVELTESYNGNDYVFTKEVLINPLPNIVIGTGSDTIYILPNSSITLDAGSGYGFYTWTPNESSNQYFDVVNEGEYSVSVTDTNCCTNTVKVYVKFANLQYPTAFKPSSDEPVNRKFTVVGNIGAISKYQINIFNRWGQLIFESDDPTKGWDGNYNGSPAPMGTYVYSAVFTSFESGVQSSIDISSRGTVTLIR